MTVKLLGQTTEKFLDVILIRITKTYPKFGTLSSSFKVSEKNLRNVKQNVKNSYGF